MSFQEVGHCVNFAQTLLKLYTGCVGGMQSIFHVTYLRGIFPEDHFKSVTMENLEGTFQSHTGVD